MLGDPGPQRNKDEVQLYLREPKLGRKEDPLKWWSHNNERHPGMAATARDHLAARCTSAQSERAFSEGRQLISEFKRQLNIETIKRSMLMKSWMEFVDA